MKESFRVGGAVKERRGVEEEKPKAMLGAMAPGLSPLAGGWVDRKLEAWGPVCWSLVGIRAGDYGGWLRGLCEAAAVQ